ncbi:MAG: HEPN domain-containing protein [Phycisphaerae bacterium]|nr:HEPN domain-containing protein [Phycisphaerae bacterium]
MDPKLEMTRQWIMRADDDLRLAELIQKDNNPVYWAIAFHAQQCAEKALKGVLTFHDIRAGKTHNLENLLKLSSHVVDGLVNLNEQAKTLSVYAVDSRYPVPHGDISNNEAIEAIETARKIFECVLKSLPDFKGLAQE